MNNGLLIYNPEDYEKNKWFVSELLSKAPNCGLSLQLVLSSELILGVHEAGLYAKSINQDAPFDNLKFVINRSRSSLIGSHFEQMGCKVFNNSQVTQICNHKGRTHQLVNSHHMPSVHTLLCNKKYTNINHLAFDYPMILKSIDGHGGSEVFMLASQQELKVALDKLPSDDFILQQPCGKPGIDIRVFALGKEIIAAVKRHNPNHFKSNYSLGGNAIGYTLSSFEEALVRNILNLLDFDLVGIYFILDENGQLLFNEIEDVVGTRTLYLNYPDIDIVALYLDYIANKI